MAQTLPKKLAMSFYDLTIIYLACGAPLGVYYFFQNRHAANRRFLWLKTILNFLFWMPFAVRFLPENKTLKKFFRKIFADRKNSDANIEKLIAPLRKSLETSIINNIPQTTGNIPPSSVFEIREIFDRYTGLTLACLIERGNSQSEAAENEFYRVTKHKNAQIASRCFARRNRKRLFFHQIQARRDFLNLIGAATDARLYRQTIEFVRFLEDSQAQGALEKMFARKAQTEKQQSVKHLEKDLWKSEKRKPLPINQPDSARLKLSLTTMNLRSKD